jgi:hypothetical protein
MARRLEADTRGFVQLYRWDPQANGMRTCQDGLGTVR